MRLFLAVVIIFGTTYINVQAQQNPEKPKAISITATDAVYTQNFDSDNADGLQAKSGLLTDLPAGWAFSEKGQDVPQIDGKYRAGSGTSSVADTYSFGTSFNNSDRALGGITSNKLQSIKVGVVFTNNTKKVINTLQVSYTGEQWRNGGFGTPGKLTFSYSTNATSLDNGDWTSITALDFTAPKSSTEVTQLNGNEASNRSVIKHQITGLSIPKKGTFWIRWENADTGKKGDGLAIDDVNVSLTGK